MAVNYSFIYELTAQDSGAYKCCAGSLVTTGSLVIKVIQMPVFHILTFDIRIDYFQPETNGHMNRLKTCMLLFSLYRKAIVLLGGAPKPRSRGG